MRFRSLAVLLLGRPPDSRQAIAGSGFFDERFYLKHNPDVAEGGVSPLDHYLTHGWKEGRRPSAAFDSVGYLALNPDIAATGVEPLQHYLEFGRAEGRPLPDINYDSDILAPNLVAGSGLFDAEYYLRSNSDIAASGLDPLDHYINHGIKEGRSPSALFDPQRYLELHPDVAAASIEPLRHYLAFGRWEGRLLSQVEDGEGSRVRTLIGESGLFDEAYYLSANPDVAEAGVDPLDHYRQHGWKEGRRPSAAFDPAGYLALYPDVAAADIEPLQHYLDAGRAEGRRLPQSREDGNEFKDVRELIVASGLFDERFYLKLYYDVALSGIDPLYHYCVQGWKEWRRPSIEFDAEGYLYAYPDVRDAGINPLLHYLEFGKSEGRRLPKVPFDRFGFEAACDRLAESGLFDSVYYLSTCPVCLDVGADPIRHFLAHGALHFLDPSPKFWTIGYLARHPDLRGRNIVPVLHHMQYGEADKRELPLRSAEDVAWKPAVGDRPTPDDIVHRARFEAETFFYRYGFRRENGGPQTHALECIVELAAREPDLKIERIVPDVSIIIPVYGQLPFVLSCLDSLALHHSKYSAEIIVCDDASPAVHETERLGAIPWVRYKRRSSNGGFIDCCNSAAESARGRYVVFLNSDTRVVDGWLDALIDTFQLFPRCGLSGSKLLNDDGSLQEAGGIYWADGTAWNYGRNNDPNHPKYCFARQADYISGASIAVPIALWRRLGGFSTDFRPAYCEDVDLAFRVREAGLEVWYQPYSRVIHYEGMTHGRDESKGIKAYQRKNMELLRQRWLPTHSSKRPNGHEPDKEANRVKLRMLIIDALPHTPDKDAGSLVSSNVLRCFREKGYQQTFVPQHGYRFDPHYSRLQQMAGIECLYGPYVDSIDQVLDHRSDYDYVLIHRFNVAVEVMGSLRGRIPNARILFSNVDLHFLRTAREAELSGDRTQAIVAARMQTEELSVFLKTDANMVHTPVEEKMVQEALPKRLENLLVFPWIAETRRSAVKFEDRHNVLFLGGFGHPPNIDAVEYFAEQIWPLVRSQIPVDAKFYIVGNAPPDKIKALAGDRIVVTGHVPELPPYLDAAKLMVVPLRYGAGIKGKIIEAMANGLPCVTTSIGAEGIGLADGQQCFIANTPAAIAESITRLYERRDVWYGLQSGGYQFVDENYSWALASERCSKVLDLADRTWLAREDHRRHQVLNSIVAGI